MGPGPPKHKFNGPFLELMGHVVEWVGHSFTMKKKIKSVYFSKEVVVTGMILIVIMDIVPVLL